MSNGFQDWLFQWVDPDKDQRGNVVFRKMTLTRAKNLWGIERKRYRCLEIFMLFESVPDNAPELPPTTYVTDQPGGEGK